MDIHIRAGAFVRSRVGAYSWPRVVASSPRLHTQDFTLSNICKLHAASSINAAA